MLCECNLLSDRVSLSELELPILAVILSLLSLSLSFGWVLQYMICLGKFFESLFVLEISWRIFTLADRLFYLLFTIETVFRLLWVEDLISLSY